MAVNGVPVAHMNYSQWKDKMTSSLHMGSITMDIRRYGNKGEIRSHKDSFMSSLIICDILTLDLQPHRCQFTECPQF